MKDEMLTLAVVVALFFVIIAVTMTVAKKQIGEICTYSLNAYPQDSITYYRLGCEIEHF